MEKKHSRKIIFFDLDDTLVHSTNFARDNRNQCFYKLVELGIGKSFDEVKTRFYEIQKEHGDNFNGHFNILVNELNHSNSKANFLIANAITSYHQYKKKISKYKFLGVDFILEKLKQKGFELGIITHGIGVKQVDKLIRLGLLKYFNSNNIHVTEVLGYNQKYTEFYEEIIEDYKNSFDEIYMVGDNENSDIVPSSEAGFKTIRVGTGGHGEKNFEETKADYKIKSISDILELDIFLDKYLIENMN